MNKDYYQILGVGKDAAQEDIKKAYRKLAHQYHPDKGGGDDAKFKEVNEAYQILGDPQKRTQYDRFGTAFEGFSAQGGPTAGWDFSGFGRGFGFNVDDIFSEFFTGTTRTRERQKGRDIVPQIEITLEEAFRGVLKEVELRKFTKCSRCKGEGSEPGTKKSHCEACKGSGEIQESKRTFFGVFSQVRTCPTCNGLGEYPETACRECGGDGRVRALEKLSLPVPAGIDNGNVIRISGKGEEGPRGGRAGDLIVEVRIKPHPVFERENENLYSAVEVSFPQAVFGDTVEVKTIDGKVDLKIPAGVQSGTELRLRAKGMPAGAGGRGDHFVTVEVKTPSKLSRKAKKLIEELKEELK